VRGLGPFPGWCHRLIYIASTLCEHACKTVCDVKPGIDPCPPPARLWHKRYQISGSFVACKKFRCCEKMSKFPLGQLQFYIFAEIVFGVRYTLRVERVNDTYQIIWMALTPLNFTRLNMRNATSVVFTLIKISFWASKWRPCQLSLSQKQELLRFSGDGQTFEKTWVLLSKEITFLLFRLKFICRA